jgi:calcium permeable stress-gated cation channel
VLSPLLLVFNIITFTLFWFAHRYNALYVNRYRLDTGGLLFPRAVNQLFVGLYTMELCLVGLFLLQRDAKNKAATIPHAIIMLVVFGLTILYQYMLRRSFSPLYQYMPITLEDDAVLRDQEFEERNRLMSTSEDRPSEERPQERDLEADNSDKPVKLNNFFADMHDELEHLTQEERDMLVDKAFTHRALRAVRPCIWVPKDKARVSEFEIDVIRSDERYRRLIWISDHNAWLKDDGDIDLSRMGKPPDFNYEKLIRL